MLDIVLIDTWWNVNQLNVDNFFVVYNVLIDTWWNVNDLDAEIVEQGWESFNRYMVECEYYQGRLDELNAGVLIDTWWNVNTRTWVYRTDESGF